MKHFCPLASGSKGNCFYLESDGAKILIDAGLSARQTRLRLAQIGVDLDQIDAILISHEHSDHIAGLKMLALKMNIPVMANAETAKAIYRILGACPRYKIFSTGETFEFNDISIHPFSVQHDASDPVAFTFQTPSTKLAICTDLGFATTLVQTHLQECDYLVLEANHEPSMVHSSPRPMVYKQRVLSRSGHLSNEACAELLLHVHHEGLKHVHLAHLSDECNSHEKALDTITSILAENNINLPVSIAHQRQISQPILPKPLTINS